MKSVYLSRKFPKVTESDLAAENLRCGTLDGQAVIDTGSHMSVVRADLIDQSKWKEKEVKLQCVHGNFVSCPTDQVLDGWKMEVPVAVVPALLDCLISYEEHFLFSGAVSGNTSLTIMKRSQKQKLMRESGYQQAMELPRIWVQHQLEGL